jgi:hypothetical protein
MNKQIPILDNRAFMSRFGHEGAFFSTIDIERFVIVPLELSISLFFVSLSTDLCGDSLAIFAIGGTA